MKILLGDCVARMAEMDEESVDAIVTDPPYELTDICRTGGVDRKGNPRGGFMGKSWDGTGIAFNPATWAAALRVLKRGGHLLAFGGTRTSHRMVCAIEDAGFEIRDSVVWMYGSGFPKSLDVSKAIDKAVGATRERAGVKAGHENFVGRDSVKALRESGALSGEGGFSRPWMYDPDQVEASHWDTAPDDAKRWQGWGTALKPAHEPICVARKPLGEKTVAGNVLKHGTGALNIDRCRIGDNPGYKYTADRNGTTFHGKQGDRVRQSAEKKGSECIESTQGRWPANVILDEEAGVMLDEQTGVLHSQDPRTRKSTKVSGGVIFDRPGMSDCYADKGGASRFFYCPKTSASERSAGLASKNPHPTVKPIALMRYLIRLVTPPGGTVLDPFLGSGSTGIAAMEEGFDFIGIEKDASYFLIARARINHATKSKAAA